MSEIIVKHTLNPRKAVKFNLNLRKYALKEVEGESVWLLEIGTTSLDAQGNKIVPKFIHKVTDAYLEHAINKAIADMCQLIDWEDFDVDRYPPSIVKFTPEGSNVPITSRIDFTIKEKNPSSGIDLSSMVVLLNNGTVDFDITSEVIIKGDPYEYNFYWTPQILYR